MTPVETVIPRPPHEVTDEELAIALAREKEVRESALSSTRQLLQKIASMPPPPKDRA